MIIGKTLKRRFPDGEEDEVLITAYDPKVGIRGDSDDGGRVLLCVKNNAPGFKAIVNCVRSGARASCQRRRHQGIGIRRFRSPLPFQMRRLK